jgi:hypothetical protein
VGGIDRSCFDFWKPNNCRGEVLWKDNFDIYSEAAMNHIRETCEAIKTAPCRKDGCDAQFIPVVVNGTSSVVRGNLLTYQDSTVTCFVDAFLDATNATISGFSVPGKYSPLAGAGGANTNAAVNGRSATSSSSSSASSSSSDTSGGSGSSDSGGSGDSTDTNAGSSPGRSSSTVWTKKSSSQGDLAKISHTWPSHRGRKQFSERFPTRESFDSALLEFSRKYKKSGLGFVNGKLRFVKILFRISMLLFTPFKVRKIVLFTPFKVRQSVGGSDGQYYDRKVLYNPIPMKLILSSGPCEK